jgi:hypothetical protein
MSIENFIRDAHYKPNDYIGYHVGRELAELHPDKAILEGRDRYFDLEAFIHSGKCSVIEQKSVFLHARTEWRGSGRKHQLQVGLRNRTREHGGSLRARTHGA